MKLKEGWKVPRRKNKVHALTSLGPQGQSGMDYDEMQNDKDQLKRSSVLGGVSKFFSTNWTFLEFGQMDENNGLD